MPERQKTVGLCRASWRQVAIPVLCYLKHGRVSQTKPHFFSSALKPAVSGWELLPWKMRVLPQPLCSWWAPGKVGRTRKALLEAHPAFLCLHCIPLPCTPVYREFSQITAALLPHWIKAAQHLQEEKWDSKYKFSQQWQLKAIGRGTVNDNTSGQPPIFSVVLYCTRALRKVTVSLQSTWNNIALIHRVVWFSVCCSCTNSK